MSNSKTRHLCTRKSVYFLFLARLVYYCIVGLYAGLVAATAVVVVVVVIIIAVLWKLEEGVL